MQVPEVPTGGHLRCRLHLFAVQVAWCKGVPSAWCVLPSHMCDTRTICGPVSVCLIVKRGVLERGVLKRGDSKVPRASSLNTQITNWLQVTISHLQTGHGGVWRLPCSPGLLAEEELGRKGETQGACLSERNSARVLAACDTWPCYMRVPGYAVLPGLTLVSLS